MANIIKTFWIQSGLHLRMLNKSQGCTRWVGVLLNWSMKTSMFCYLLAFTALTANLWTSGAILFLCGFQMAQGIKAKLKITLVFCIKLCVAPMLTKLSFVKVPGYSQGETTWNGTHTCEFWAGNRRTCRHPINRQRMFVVASFLGSLAVWSVLLGSLVIVLLGFCARNWHGLQTSFHMKWPTVE